LAVRDDWEWNRENPYFAIKDTALELTDHGNTAVALSSLVVIFSIIEVALAVCAAWISDSLSEPLQENQISQVCEGKHHLGTREITIISFHKKNSANKNAREALHTLLY